MLALRDGVTVPTIRKWQSRADVQDRSHRSHRLDRLGTMLSEGKEAVVAELCRMLMLPMLGVDDLLVVTREFVNLCASRSIHIS